MPGDVTSFGNQEIKYHTLTKSKYMYVSQLSGFFQFLVASSTSSKSLATDSVEIKALRENMTSFQVALVRECTVNKKHKASTSRYTSKSKSSCSWLEHEYEHKAKPQALSGFSVAFLLIS